LQEGHITRAAGSLGIQQRPLSFALTPPKDSTACHGYPGQAYRTSLALAERLYQTLGAWCPQEGDIDAPTADEINELAARALLERDIHIRKCLPKLVHCLRHERDERSRRRNTNANPAPLAPWRCFLSFRPRSPKHGDLAEGGASLNSTPCFSIGADIVPPSLQKASRMIRDLTKR
jgi:hypothetical protein